MRDVPAGDLTTNLGSKSWKDSFSPVYEAAKGANNKYDSSKEFQAQLQLGSKLFPEHMIRRHAESYYQLRKSLGIHGSAFHSINIKGNEFMTNKFVLGIDTGKVLGASFSGYNTKSGDLITLALENNGLANGDRTHSI